MTGHHDSRVAIVDAARALNASGLNQGTSGNISVRAGAGYLITPTSLDYEAMRPADIPLIDLSTGDRAEGDRAPSSEWRFHRDIYRARADVSAVVHCHAPFATALAILGDEIPPIHYMIAIFGGDRIPVAPYATYGTRTLSDHVVATLADGWGILLANHGMIACGTTLAQAMWRAEELENLARQFVTARQIGDPVLLNADQIAGARSMMQKGYGQTD